VLYIAMFILSRYPHLYNYPWEITEDNAEIQYRMASAFMNGLATGIAWIFLYMTWQTIQTALGNANGLGGGFLFVALFLTLGPLVLYLFVAGQARNRYPNKR